jgi:hypothetical protein
MASARSARLPALFRILLVVLVAAGCCAATTAVAATSDEVGRSDELRLADPGTAGRLAPLTAPRRPRPAHAIMAVRAGRVVTMRSAPGGTVLKRVGARTEFGTPTALSVVKRHGRWLGVTTAVRPNGRLAWVDGHSRALRRSATRLTIRVDLSARRIELRRGDRVLERGVASIGRPGAPTPTGRFAVTDKLRGDRFGAYYGCCILALSGTQPKPPPGWPGGTRVAIHGTPNPATLGNADSAGCVHASTATLQTLMRRVPVGTPVFIVK